MSDCIITKYALNEAGYGRRGINGKNYYVHRLALEKKLGRPIRPGYCALHNCPGGDNRACENPDHLWEGTRADNNADMAAKGRTARGDRHGSRTHPEALLRGDKHWTALHPELVNVARGEDHYQSKLSEQDVSDILDALASGPWGTGIILARRYGVGAATISNIKNGNHWRTR